MRTISSSYLYVYLNKTTDNPVTVTSTGSISSKMNGIALHLMPPTDNPNLFWSITNYGRITSQGTASQGVVIENGGQLVNGSSTATSAYIAGGALGVSFPQGAGHLTNYGTIVASGLNNAVVDLKEGGEVKNLGLLQGQDNASVVRVDGAVGNVVNYGTINVLPGLAGVAVGLYDGGSLINGSATTKTALLSGGGEGAGFAAQQVAATLSNYGSIFGGYGAFLGEGGTIVNRGGITGFLTGVRVVDGSATIANFGTISSAYLEPASASSARSAGSATPAWVTPPHIRAAVNFAGTAGGSITNGSTGYIGGGSYGVYAAGAPVTLANNGTIAGGVYLRMGGMVTNGRPGSTGGHLSGVAVGVAIQGAAGNVVNYGTVSASNRSGSAIKLSNGGVVRNFGVAEAGVGVDLRGTGSILINGGIVRSTASTYGAAVSIESGNVSNSAGGYIGATYGIGVSNDRYGGRAALLIAAEQTRYRAALSSGYGPVAVANNGTIADGVLLLAGGSVTNGESGSTRGLITGIEASSTGRLLGYQAVYIAAASGAVSVTNFGTMAADKGAGVRLPNGGTVDNARGALISGSYAGIGIGGAGTVTNSGTITASGSTGIGVNLKNSFGQTVTNSGTITGTGGTAVAFGAGNDRLVVGAGAKFNGVVNGGGGSNEIDFAKPGKVVLAPEYLGFPVVRLGNGAADSLTLTAADFVGIAGNQIAVYGGDRGNTITAALPSADKLVLHGGTGADRFSLSVATLANAKVTGGAGPDRLTVASAGAVALGGVGGIETIALSSGGPNTLVLRDANFGGVTGRRITVLDGNAGDVIVAAPVSDDAVVLRGGSGDDSFFFTPAGLTASDMVAGGGGSDRLVLTGGGTARIAGVGGVETYRLFAGASDAITLSDGNFAGVTGNTITVFAGDAGDAVSAAALSAAHRVVLVGGAGPDIFSGGAGNDTFEVSARNLGASDRLRGGGGADRLLLLGAGAVVASGVSGIETIQLSSAAKNTLTLTDANFAGVTGRTVTVIGGNAGNAIAAALPAADKLVLHGGAGGDTFDLSAAALAGAKVSGGQGADRLVLTSAGTLTAAGVGGVETYVLANGGADTLTLTDANFAGVTGNAITVEGGNAGNRISEAAVAAADLATIKGGAGVDTLITGRHAVMTGGAGKDVFELATPGTTASPDRNSITDFTHGTDQLAFSNIGFHLGLAKASATPQKLAASLFSTKTNGTFDKSGERFAYDKSTDHLYFDADGAGASHTRQLVATLADHPTVTAGDLFFVT